MNKLNLKLRERILRNASTLQITQNQTSQAEPIILLREDGQQNQAQLTKRFNENKSQIINPPNYSHLMQPIQQERSFPATPLQMLKTNSKW